MKRSESEKPAKSQRPSKKPRTVAVAVDGPRDVRAELVRAFPAKMDLINTLYWGMSINRGGTLRGFENAKAQLPHVFSNCPTFPPMSFSLESEDPCPW